MLSKSQISFVKSLHTKKNRKEAGLFIVEGVKSVTEFIDSDYEVDTIFCTEKNVLKVGILSQNVKLFEIKDEELRKISALTTPQQVLALVKVPKESFSTSIKASTDNFTLVLDDIQDPGNLGTIIRTADWFGFKQIICSLDTVDAYNPKVVQASMGSISRIKIQYTDISSFLENCFLPIYGALLDGKPIQETKFLKAGVLVLGNEGNGISQKVRHLIQYPVTIPSYGKAESLNVAISAGIFCMEIKKAV